MSGPFPLICFSHSVFTGTLHSRFGNSKAGDDRPKQLQLRSENVIYDNDMIREGAALLSAEAAEESLATIEESCMPWRFLPLGLLLTGLVLGYAMGWHEHLNLQALVESRTALHTRIEAHPVLSAAGFTILYATAVAVAFPAASLLTVAAGFLFGWFWGGTLAVVAATAGATALFLAARSAFGDFLRRRVGGRAARLARGFEKGAFGYLLVLRLTPIFPFWMVNIVPAFFNVRLGTFVAATAIGILPATYAYAYLGRGLESALLSAAAAGRELQPGDLLTKELTFALAALAIVAALALIVKKMRAADPS